MTLLIMSQDSIEVLSELAQYVSHSTVSKSLTNGSIHRLHRSSRVRKAVDRYVAVL